MAAVTRTEHAGNSYMASWTLTTADHTGDSYEHPGAADRTVQASGTFGGATVAIEGSNNGSTWSPLTDPGGTAITFTSAGIEAIAENPLYVRARLSVTGIGATIVVNMLNRSPR
jgi:hypothetical protein